MKIKNYKIFKRWKKRQIFYGNSPAYIYREALRNLTMNELDNLQAKMEFKKNNILLTEKIFYWVISTLTIGLISSGIITMKNYTGDIDELLRGFWVLLVSYLILVITLIITVQSTKNTIILHKRLIDEEISQKRFLNNEKI